MPKTYNIYNKNNNIKIKKNNNINNIKCKIIFFQTKNII